MRYRIHPRTHDRISELGMGTSYICEADAAQAVAAIRTAFEGGVNYYDLATAHKRSFSYFAEALGDVRKQVLYQVHFGADYSAGEYGWSTDPNVVKRNISETLQTLKTDTIDYGFIHCIDEAADFHAYCENGVLDYLCGLQKQGVVRHIGLSSHTPAAIMQVMDAVQLDMLMFSVNAGYEYHHGEYARGSVAERAAVYRRCQAEGVGISVMKPFSGGQLLDAALSPFGKALTQYQCLQYALDRPAVLTVLPGASSVAEVTHLLDFFDADDATRDYSIIGSFTPPEAVGSCVYCNHCKPCSVGLDIGLINKYYDLARHGDAMAAEHYHALSHHATDCIHCGHCDARCPFSVQQSDRMAEIAAFFQ